MRRVYLVVQGLLADLAAALAGPRPRPAAVRAGGHEGQQLIELAILITLVAIVAAAGARYFGEGIANLFRDLLVQVTGTVGGGGGRP